MNPYDEVQRGRLFRAVETSFRKLEPFRSLNRGLVEEYAGSGYGQMERPRHEILVNLMNQTVDAYTMALVANRPRVMLSTEHAELTAFAKHFEVAINNLIKEIGLEYTLRKWVLDAFFCVGLIKVHLADSGPVQLEQNLWMDPGTPYASNVSLDNWVHDMSATNWYEVKYAGDCYRICFEAMQAEAGGIYDANVVKDLAPTSKYAAEGDERLERISKGYEVDQDEFEPMIDLADIWVPRDGMIYTYAVDSLQGLRLKGAPVAAMPWDGPEFGPYHILGFNDVPENIMPASPAAHLSALGRLANNILRKQRRRAGSAKRMHTYTPAGAEDARRLKNAGDDEWVQVQDPREIGQVDVGGVDPQLNAFFLGVLEMYDRMAGNLTAMLGLGSQADTASQEQLIHAASSKKEANMQYRVIDGSVRVIRDLGYMLWHDPIKTIRGQFAIDGAEGYVADATWTPEDREGDFFDYNFGIDLFSMPYQSPSQKMSALMHLITQVYAPMVPALQQQGGMLDMQKMTDIFADLMNEPRLREIIKFANAMPTDRPGPLGIGERDIKAPAVSSRTYTRRNVPTGGTQQGRSHVMQQAWLGQNVNPDQAASMSQNPA